MGQCPKCGTAVRPDQAACTNCGVDLTAVPRPNPAARSKPRGAVPPGSGLEAVVALVLSLVFQWLIDSVVPTDAYLYRLFRPEGGWIMSVVPALIAFTFIWAIMDLVLKFRIARVNEADVARPEVKQLPVLLGQEEASVTLRRVRAWDRGLLMRPVGRRILWLLHHLGTTDAQRAHELVRHQSDVDADATASGYRAVKLFIWAMPILGFIGTVLGISLAVGGFSEFLTTSVSIDEVDRVTAELGEVASGLSFAFDTTLLGLLAGLVSNVVSSAVQAREERLLTRLEELGLRIMANAQPSQTTAEAPVAVAASASTEAFEQMLRGRLGELSGQMDHFTRTIQSGLDALRDASARMNAGIAESIVSVGQTLEGLGTDIEGVSGTLARGMNRLGERVSSMEEANGRSEQAMQGLSSSVAQLGQSLGEYREAQTALASELGQGLGEYREAQAALASELGQGLGEYREAQAALASELGRSLGEYREAQAALASELGRSLGEYREAQAALAPVLTQLAGPLELRLMPTALPLAAPASEGNAPAKDTT